MPYCAHCDQPFERERKRGRPATLCSAACRTARQELYEENAKRKPQKPKRNAICADCGGPCQRGAATKNWTPPAESRCRACHAKKRAADKKRKTTCACGNTKMYEAQTCLACLREAQKTHRLAHPPKSTSAEGYDRKHKRIRQAWAALMALTPIRCARCGEQILDNQSWHLDHGDDRDEYLGPSHSRCNLSAPKTIRSPQLYSVKPPA